MRRISILLILSGATLLAGCRTDPAAKQAEQIDSHAFDATAEASAPEPGGSAPSTSIAKLNDGRPLIVCFGDSLTAGYGTGPGESYPDFLQIDLDNDGYKYRVVNEGVSGDTTKDGINRLATVLALRAAVVVVEFGGNDGLRGLPIAESRANLDTMISKISKAGSKVVIAGITLPPNYGAAYIQQFNATYTILAKKYNVPVLPFLLKDVYGVPGMMQADQTHATATGNKVVAMDVLSLVTPLLHK